MRVKWSTRGVCKTMARDSLKLASIKMMLLPPVDTRDVGFESSEHGKYPCCNNFLLDVVLPFLPYLLISFNANETYTCRPHYR